MNNILSVNIKGIDYDVIVEGSGVPCITIGNGLLVHRTVSNKFKENFKLYATDLYWGYRQRLTNPTSLTFDNILDDIATLIHSLNLDRPIIFGFSAFGIVGLEFIKRYPNLARAIIMVGTPLNSNLIVAQENEKIFIQSADTYRKEIDAYRRGIVAQEDLSRLVFHERFKREYIYRDAPRYWHNPEFDCNNLWEGIELDKVIDHFFTSLIPYVDVTKEIDKIDIPVYLAAGLSDFDCCPAQAWGASKALPRKFTLDVYSQSGHYPQLEEQNLFDSRITEWLKSISQKIDT